MQKKQNKPVYRWVRPGDFDPPLIGSGRISRRLIFSSFVATERRKKKAKLPVRRIKASWEPENINISFPDNDVKMTFYYWQQLGYPFVKHIERRTTTLTNAIRNLQTAIKKHGKLQVIEAMGRCRKLFNSGSFRFKYLYDRKRLGLPDFIGYKPNTYKLLASKKAGIILPKSWLNTCLKMPVKELIEEYSFITKAKNKQVAQRLTEIWSAYKRGVVPDNDNTSINKVANKLQDFCEKNNIEVIIMLNLIDKMLNTWHNYSPTHLGWLHTDLFFQNILPDELVRFGILKEREKYNIKY